MIRILVFLILVFVLGIGFAWLADRPGELVVTFGHYQYGVSLMVAAVAVIAVIAAAMIAWWLVKSVLLSPYTVSRYFRVRRRDRGYQALSTGMIAVAAGDGAAAQRMNKQAAKLISADQEPLLHLLDAQTHLLAGDHEAARLKFEAMLDDPQTRPLGLRGLYLEAERLNEKEAARHYAARAAEAAPQLTWAASAALEEKTEEGDWDGALRLLDAGHAVGQIDRDAAARRRAVLLTAKANDMLARDPAGAKSAALEANRLAPEFVPAAITAATALFRQNDLRRGSRMLEAAWKKTAHPDIAEAYVHARPGDSTRDRLERAQRLRSLRRNNAEAELTVARAALAAGDYGLAREQADAALRLDPREGAFLLRADIEEAETGDQGRVRAWLTRAVRAKPDPAWVADGHVSAEWKPLSPVTGRLDAFEWRSPIERLGPVIEDAMPELRQAALPRQLTTLPAEPLPQEASPQDNPGGELSLEQAAQRPAERQEATVNPDVPAAAASEVPAEGSPSPVAAGVPAEDSRLQATAEAAATIVKQPDDPSLPVEEPGRGSAPDDPGVEPPRQEKPARRFRLF